MEKISGIIPASARTQAVDTSNSQPARPGAPALGRPMGKNSLGDRVTMSKQLEAMKAASAELGEGATVMTPAAPVYTNPAESRKQKVVDELNKKFFSNPLTEARQSDMKKSEEALKTTQDTESLFFVEKALQPTSDPLKPVIDNKTA